MILNPGILALLLGSLIATALLFYAAGLGVRILRRWDARSCSEEQLQLERRTYLVSTIVNFALGFEILSGLLFVYTLEDIHGLFIGAMCATGSLNANPVGWALLLVKIILFFFAALWVQVNRLDQRTEDTPLVRPKYLALLVLAPLVGLDLLLQYSYFGGLKPEIITSCCGSLFSLGNKGVASELAGLPPQLMMLVFSLSAAACIGLLLACLRWSWALLRQLLFACTLGFFFVALVSVVSFISLYIYQMPTHHCPFDMLQRNYAGVGYPLYGGLFAGTLYGLLPGLCQPLGRSATLKREIGRVEKRWLLTALAGLGLFLLLVAWPIFFGPFVLLGY